MLFVRAEGVTLPEGSDGVTLAFDSDGVMRPVEAEGVTLPLIEGVVRPLRVDATDAGRDTIPFRIAGGDSLVEATNTPQLGGQLKYCTLKACQSPVIHA
jgi:hypothetical protein